MDDEAPTIERKYASDLDVLRGGLSELAARCVRYREAGETIAHCHGTFDLLHVGHIKHLNKAKSLADRLIVTLTADRFVNKGPGRPVFNEDLRAEQLLALKAVDDVAIINETTALSAIKAVRPNVYVKGSDYKIASDDVTGNIAREQSAVESIGGQIHFTDELTFSSSALLNTNFNVFPAETKTFLESFKQHYNISDIFTALDRLSSLKVLVFGDAIIDEYHYTQPLLGRVGKGNNLAVQFSEAERFAGGAMAVANHIAEFSNHVTLLTGLGQNSDDEAFVRSKLNPKVSPAIFNFSNAETLIKRRFVDTDMSKLFEIYCGGLQNIESPLNHAVVRWLSKNLKKFDLVVVPDFGNGLITSDMIGMLCEKARFLAVNTQVNSGNSGYHVIHRYPRADFVSLNEPELRLAAHERYQPIEAVAEKVRHRVNARFIAVTQGAQGVKYLERGGQPGGIPALSTEVVDRIGAGDAFLSLASSLLASGSTLLASSFVGAVAAALDVQIVCNREPVKATRLRKYVTTLLK